MHVYLNDSFERISEIISFLGANLLQQNEYTVVDIANILDIPLSVLRDDLAKMIESKHEDTKFFVGNLEIGTIDCDVYSADAMRMGLYDNETIGFDFSVLTFSAFAGSRTFLLPLTKFESPVVQRWFGQKEPFFHIKRNYGELPGQLKIKLNRIYDAIEQDKAIIFDYIENNGTKTRNRHCKPKEIRFNSQNPESARLVSEDGLVFNVYGIDNIVFEKIKNHTHDNIKVEYDWENVWDRPDSGAEQRNTPVYVKLKIKNSTRNIINKLQADTARRGKKVWTELESGDYIYEDIVSGFDDFKTWVMGYGSNIIVVEPQWLADSILEEFRKLRKQYETGQFE